jgi:energy-coupling factor transporter ATP-binding protein EcfA2
MDYYTNLTKYFRQSLIDADRICPEDKEIEPAFKNIKTDKEIGDYFVADRDFWFEGKINENLAKQIIKKRVGNENPGIKETELVIFPRIDFLKSDKMKKSLTNPNVLIPLVVFVILKEDGSLNPSNKAPWIPREWVFPNQGNFKPFTEIETIDNFLTKYPYKGIETFEQLREYSTAMLCASRGIEYFFGNNAKEKNIKSIYEIEILDNYVPKEEFLIQVKEPPVVGVKEGIIRILDTILEKKPDIPLYYLFCAKSSPELLNDVNIENNKNLSKLHIGQMTGEFPLSKNQRNSLHHLLKNQKTEILAVNGPPGTGKTTLLRSVVASLWAKAALEEKEPPLIAAASNNNQAVTNILESFAKVDESGVEENLKGRWLPDITSYGLYCCAGDKTDKTPYMYYNSSKPGCMENYMTLEYLEKAEPFFLQKAQKWLNNPVYEIFEVKNKLHEKIRETKEKIDDGIETLHLFLEAENKIKLEFVDFESLIKEIEILSDKNILLEKESESIFEKKDALFRLWNERSIFVRMFFKLKFVNTKEFNKNAILFNTWGIHLEDKSDKAAEKILKDMEDKFSEKKVENKQRISELKNLRDSYEYLIKKITEWIKKNKPENLLSKNLTDQVNEICDRVLRFKLFKLATHYWESRWLIETKTFFDNQDSDKKSVLKVVRKFKRFAKLTPCIVSTFYMLPKIFTAGYFEEKVWIDIPLFNELDLLIIDEAGQALPEVSAPSFSLAKKALVVGDTDQIEPVWSISPGVDRANLNLFNLFESEENYSDFWLKSGLLASSGNVMTTAQRQCRLHQFPQLQRGLYLTEHRRCFNSIVEYCNKLVYKGVLEPLRGESKIKIPWGQTMSMVNVRENSKSYSGSRGNYKEAEAIVNWLFEKQSEICDYVRKIDPKLKEKSEIEILELSIGIITPFSTQAAFIRSQLIKKGIKKITVGTVHSLQGDERLIVIFSSVYGESDKQMGKFYDRSPNMLNVAVSRAKDAFVVFGHPEVFGTFSNSSPSGILRSMVSVLK